MKVVGLLLAGGQSRRMGGGDKALRMLGGTTLLERVIERLRPQVDALVLNANGDPSRFARFALPVVPDSIPGFAGPLAGVLAGLDWAAAQGPDYMYIVSVATDAPFLPDDLVMRLTNGLMEAGADLACAPSGGRAHPVFGQWPARWTGRHRLMTVPFADMPVGPFFNANRPADSEAAASPLKRIRD